jgi:hypothetical protein
LDFVQNVEYQIELKQHSRIMLAFRYGIAEESDQISGFFEGYQKDKKDPLKDMTDRRICTFNISGERVTAVMKGNIVVTVLPQMSSLKTVDANLVLSIFDGAFAGQPNLMTMNEIVTWREEYLNANGTLNKDDARRFVREKRPDYRTPMEILGLPENFFEEVTELRQYVKEQGVKNFFAIDSSDLDAMEEHAKKDTYLGNLGVSEHTLLYEETAEGLENWVAEAEYRDSEEFYGDMLEMSSSLINTEGDQNTIKPPPVLGIPFGSSPHDYFDGKPCFFHDDCIVTSVKISSCEDGYHELHYENDKKRFITVTKQKWIIDKYSVGQRGVWSMELSKNFFVLQQPMERDK